MASTKRRRRSITGRTGTPPTSSRACRAELSTRQPKTARCTSKVPASEVGRNHVGAGSILYRHFVCASSPSGRGMPAQTIQRLRLASKRSESRSRRDRHGSTYHVTDDPAQTQLPIGGSYWSLDLFTGLPLSIARPTRRSLHASFRRRWSDIRVSCAARGLNDA